MCVSLLCEHQFCQAEPEGGQLNKQPVVLRQLAMQFSKWPAPTEANTSFTHNHSRQLLAQWICLTQPHLRFWYRFDCMNAISTCALLEADSATSPNEFAKVGWRHFLVYHARPLGLLLQDQEAQICVKRLRVREFWYFL